VLLADRNYLRPVGVHAAAEAGAYALLRLRWSHSPMVDCRQRPFHALPQVKKLRVSQVGVWSVKLSRPAGQAVSGRVVATRLSAPLVAKVEQRITKSASKKGRQLNPRTLQAAHFVMIFTTLPATLLGASGVLDLYRYRWQIELAFKRLKQLLKLGHLPHQHPDITRTWILAKLVVALLLETLYRNACVFSRGAIGSKPSLQPARDLMLSLWRWTAVLVHALRHALCLSPGLLTLLAATSRGDLRR
jgi:Transposase DDE domain